MIIAVAYKWAADPQEAVVSPDGVVDLSRAKSVVSDDDAVAIELGRRLADDSGAELVGISVGGPATAAPMATKTALARGLDRALIAVGDDLAGAGTTRVAAVLGALVRRLGDVRLVLTGDSSIDVGAKMVPAVLGGVLGWPTLAEVGALTLEDAHAAATRIRPAGVQELRVGLPAVIAVARDAASPRVPGMKDVLAAGKKPVEQVAVAGLALPPADEGTLRSTGPLPAPARRGIVISGADPRAAAAELVAALAGAGVLSAAEGVR
jgi:electron transfer flavoprotein beta subunit